MHHQNYHQNQRSIWAIDDSEFYKKPSDRFNDGNGAFISMQYDQWAAGVFDQITKEDLPLEFERFVSNFLTMFGVRKGILTKVYDIIIHALHYIDYQQPYYVLVDTMVHLTKDGANYTYKHKNTGETLNPNKIETFKLNMKHQFIHYDEVKKLCEHPITKSVLSGKEVFSSKLNKNLTKKDIAEQIARIVYGDPGHYNQDIEEMYETYFHNDCFREYLTPSGSEELQRAEIESAFRNDFDMWYYGILACFVWFKGREGAQFFIDYHPVWGAVFKYHNATLVADHEAGGEIVVDGVNIYTMKDLLKYENVPAGTCECCGGHMHCTQLLNLTAIKFPTCSCGENVDVFETDIWNHGHKHRKNACKTYLEQHPIRAGFICQHCIYTTINNLPMNFKCGKAVCPNVTCKHHLGEHARIRALTEMRTRQLTHVQKS